MKKFLVISYIIARTWCLFESIRKPEEGCAFQESTRSVHVILLFWITWGLSLRTVKSGLFRYRYYMIACQPVTEGYKRTGNGWCTRGERATERLIYVCFLVLMLCDWLILTWHLPTLERAIKPLSEELIERFIQIAHIWGFNEGWSNENNIVWTGVFFPTIYHVIKGNCDRIEDETHFLLDCPNFSSIIEMFFSKLDPKIPFLRPQSHETLSSNLMNSTDYFINIQLSFIYIILLWIERQTCLRDN